MRNNDNSFALYKNGQINAAELITKIKRYFQKRQTCLKPVDKKNDERDELISSDGNQIEQKKKKKIVNPFYEDKNAYDIKNRIGNAKPIFGYP